MRRRRRFPLPNFVGIRNNNNKNGIGIARTKEEENEEKEKEEKEEEKVEKEEEEEKEEKEPGEAAIRQKIWPEIKILPDELCSSKSDCGLLIRG